VDAAGGACEREGDAKERGEAEKSGGEEGGANGLGKRNKETKL